MDRNTFTSSFKRNIVNKAPKAFMLFLASMVAIECGIHSISPLLAANSEYLGIQARIRVANMENLNRDILILGDSTAGVAINPKRLHEMTGLLCANLATQAGTTIAANYFLFEDYLKANNPPKYIILMRGFNSWAGKSSDYINELLLGNFSRNTFKLLSQPWLVGSNYEKLLNSIPCYLLPSQRNGLAIRKTVQMVVGGQKTIPELLNESQQKMTEWEQRILGEIPYNIGSEGTAEEREKNLLMQMNYVSNNTFHTSEWSAYYLEQLITLAKQNGTIIYISLCPVRKELYEDDAGRVYLNTSKEFIVELCGSHENVVLLTDDFYYVTADQIRNNGNHLNAEESIVFTDMLAGKILANDRT